MAILTDEEKKKIRNGVERIADREGVSVHWVKGAINDAAQAVEDFLVDNASTMSTEINTASQPYGVTFNADEKKWIVALTALMKHNRDTA